MGSSASIPSDRGFQSQAPKACRITGEAVVLAPATTALVSAWACVLGQRWVAAEEALG